MHGVGTAVADRIEDRLGVQIALRGGLPAERVRLVGESHVERVAVELRVHGDGSDAELASGPDDTDRDLASVGDQDLLQHRCQCRCPWVRRTVFVGTESGREAGDWPAGWTVEHVAVKPGARTPTCFAAAADGAPDRLVLVHRPPDGGPGSPRPGLDRAAGREPAGLDPVPGRCRTTPAS